MAVYAVEVSRLYTGREVAIVEVEAGSEEEASEIAMTDVMDGLVEFIPDENGYIGGDSEVDNVELLSSEEV